MKEVYFNDVDFIQTDIYKNFIDKNKGSGSLNIRAYAAGKAIPINGLNITVFKVLDNYKVVFFEGSTDSSGVINNIVLPTPIISDDKELIPLSQDYDVVANYENQKLFFKIILYSNIEVNQNINITPNIRLDGKTYGG